MRRSGSRCGFALVLFGLAAPIAGAAQGIPLNGAGVDSLGPIFGAGLHRAHEVEVYLPPGYTTESGRRYPVLYSNDGQALKVMDVAAIVATQVMVGRMSPIIVVAIHSDTDYRGEEYALAGQRAMDINGAGAAAYQQFVLDSVMPRVEASYRVLTGPSHTAFMGWSLGALSAFDMVWNHPERFGIAGLFSGSFWWRDNNGTPAERQAGRLTHQMVRAGQPHPGQRFWFMAGRREETDDRDGNGVIDAIQDADELIGELEKKGYQRGGDVAWRVVDGDHSLSTWARTLPEFLSWAFPSGATGN
ncbi:MAG TPA: alpha/beta hydrolase-fold protein [Gemmatimonadales bacterium]|nr:alpha/beta hydrolase-fold protein [Gemmatimonadales bacterium]